MSIWARVNSIVLAVHMFIYDWFQIIHLDYSNILHALTRCTCVNVNFNFVLVRYNQTILVNHYNSLCRATFFFIRSLANHCDSIARPVYWPHFQQFNIIIRFQLAIQHIRGKKAATNQCKRGHRNEHTKKAIAFKKGMYKNHSHSQSKWWKRSCGMRTVWPYKNSLEWKYYASARENNKKQIFENILNVNQTIFIHTRTHAHVCEQGKMQTNLGRSIHEIA